MMEHEVVNSTGAELAKPTPAVLVAVGCGGGGSNAINRMLAEGVEHVEFMVINTDLQALNKSPAPVRIPIGQKLTGGLGAGGNPEVGCKAAEEDRETIKNSLTGADMVFITAGMGGGTGTGSVPVVADIARKMGALTVAVVTTPFAFEGYARKNHAEAGIEKLRSNVDSLIVIPNEQIFKLVKEDLNMKSSFFEADKLLCSIVRGMTDIIIKEGEPNLDFNDMCTVMRNKGSALLGVGHGDSENRAIDAAQSALSNPLLEGIRIDGAKNVLINITSGTDWKLRETNELVSTITASTHKNCNVFVGNVIEESMGSRVNVIVIATGFEKDEPEEEAPVETVIEKDPNVIDANEFNSILQGTVKSPVMDRRNDEMSGFGTFESPVRREGKASSLGADLFESVERKPASQVNNLVRPASYNGPNDETMPACWRNQGSYSRTINLQDDN